MKTFILLFALSSISLSAIATDCTPEIQREEKELKLAKLRTQDQIEWINLNSPESTVENDPYLRALTMEFNYYKRRLAEIDLICSP